jgi:3'(2'), 5'-bisphosphate nucleotidase
MLRFARFDRDVRFAVETVREAMRVARSLEGRTHASTKPDCSPVSVADFAIQAVVAERLRRAYPGDSLLAEEDAGLVRASAELATDVAAAVRLIVPDVAIEQVVEWIGEGGSGGGSRCWTLDPIDGTQGFLHGRQYVTALALVVDGSVALSVIGCPRLSVDSGGDAGTSSRHGGIALAARGHGAWWSAGLQDRFQRLAVSTCGDMSGARLVQSFEAGHGDPDRCARAVRALRIPRPPLLLDSQAKHVTVAAGVSDLLLRFPPHPEFHDAVWDQAAGSLLIEEAGGRVTDLAGRPLDFTTGSRLRRNTGLLASNGLLHDAALKAIA